MNECQTVFGTKFALIRCFAGRANFRRKTDPQNTSGHCQSGEEFACGVTECKFWKMGRGIEKKWICIWRTYMGVFSRG
jgi:hypothetical protein